VIFDEAFHQLLARIRELVVEVHLNRQKHLRLDVEERCGQNVELGDIFEIDARGKAQIREVLLGDLSYRNVVDVDLVLLDQE